MQDQNRRERLLFEEAKSSQVPKNEESTPVSAQHVKNTQLEAEMGFEVATSKSDENETRYHFKRGLNLYQLLQENTAHKNLEDVF